MGKRFLFGVMFVSVGIMVGVVITPLISGDNIYDQMSKFKEVFFTAYRNYVDEVDPEKLTEAAIEGMLSELDPHSVYISAENMKSVDEDFEGKFEGVGIQFDIRNDTITVVSPIAGGPSEQLGIQSGDKIVTIDDEDVVGIPRDEVPKKLKGPKGTIVKVGIVRSGIDEILDFEITRDEIPIYTVDASFIMDDTDIGVIVVNRFAATTHEETVKAINKLKAQGMKKLILDLRGNPGGYLNQAFYMADEFLADGDTIVYTKGRIEQFDEVFRSTAGGNSEDLPIIVMINAGSASASEIVSGAMQDLDRGLVVGTTSFGKGLVQRQYKVRDGSAFRITISRYFTPSGRSIQRPYDDEKEYRRLVGRLELEEGANIKHALERIKADDSDTLNIDDFEIYYTRSGRTVLGGGGITPDYIIKQDTITMLGRQLRAKRLFFEFVNNNLESGKPIITKYGGDFNTFNRNFKVDDKMMKDFLDFAKSKDIKWTEEEFAADKDFLATEIKANIAQMGWDREKYIQVFFDIDRQIQKAKTLFPEAAKIAQISN